MQEYKANIDSTWNGNLTYTYQSHIHIDRPTMYIQVHILGIQGRI